MYQILIISKRENVIVFLYFVSQTDGPHTLRSGKWKTHSLNAAPPP